MCSHVIQPLPGSRRSARYVNSASLSPRRNETRRISRVSPGTCTVSIDILITSPRRRHDHETTPATPMQRCAHYRCISGGRVEDWGYTTERSETNPMNPQDDRTPAAQAAALTREVEAATQASTTVILHATSTYGPMTIEETAIVSAYPDAKLVTIVYPAIQHGYLELGGKLINIPVPGEPSTIGDILSREVYSLMSEGYRPVDISERTR